jgi:hypothetical protein
VRRFHQSLSGDIFLNVFRTKQNNTYIYSHQNENQILNHGKSQDEENRQKEPLKTAKEKRRKREKKTVLKRLVLILLISIETRFH